MEGQKYTCAVKLMTLLFIFFVWVKFVMHAWKILCTTGRSQWVKYAIFAFSVSCPGLFLIVQQ